MSTPNKSNQDPTPRPNPDPAQQPQPRPDQRPNPDPAPRPQNDPSARPQNDQNPRPQNEPVVDLRRPQPAQTPPARTPDPRVVKEPTAPAVSHEPDPNLRGRPKLTPHEWTRSPEKGQFTFDTATNTYIRNAYAAPERSVNDPSPIKPGHPADTSFPAGGAPDPGNPDRRPR